MKRMSWVLPWLLLAVAGGLQGLLSLWGDNRVTLVALALGAGMLAGLLPVLLVRIGEPLRMDGAQLAAGLAGLVMAAAALVLSAGGRPRFIPAALLSVVTNWPFCALAGVLLGGSLRRGGKGFGLARLLAALGLLAAAVCLLVWTGDARVLDEEMVPAQRVAYGLSSFLALLFPLAGAWLAVGTRPMPHNRAMAWNTGAFLTIALLTLVGMALVLFVGWNNGWTLHSPALWPMYLFWFLLGLWPSLGICLLLQTVVLLRLLWNGRRGAALPTESLPNG